METKKVFWKLLWKGKYMAEHNFNQSCNKKMKIGLDLNLRSHDKFPRLHELQSKDFKPKPKIIYVSISQSKFMSKTVKWESD